MKTLYIVRHAKASKEPGFESDHERPLTERGKTDAKLVAQTLRKEKWVPSFCVASTAKRAQKTARIFHEEWGISQKLELESSIYEASVSDLIHVVRSLPEKENKVAIFGHNPGFTGLIGALSQHFIEHLPTSGVAIVEFKIDTWKLVGSQPGKLVRFVHPKLINVEK